MVDHVWSGEKKRRAINSKDLEMRLAINKKYQSKDFIAWLRKRLDVKPNEKILDVGCGTGAQTIFMAEDAGQNGHVTSFDISEESISVLKNNLPDCLKNRVSAYSMDMADMKEFLDRNCPGKQYTLAQSSYALYYSPHRIEVLAAMQERTKDFGRVAVFTPCPPHEMIEFASKYHNISAPVTDSLNFGIDTLIPLFRECFWEVEVHYFQSILATNDINDFKSFYEASTYYDKNSAEEVIKGANSQIIENGSLDFKKCGVLLIGSSLNKLATEIQSNNQ